MPPVGSKIASDVDNLYSFLLWTSLLGCAILIGGMIFFAIKYKRRTDTDKVPYISHNTFLEFLWSFVPLVLFLVVFAWGWKVYHDMRTMPENAYEVHVQAKQWAWDFVYKSGKISTNEFFVPVGVPVKLVMASDDVLHSFYIPSLRIKQDVVPGRYTTLWFNAEKTGSYQVFCTEYCGAAHSGMMAKMNVVPMADFEKWLLENDEGLSLAEKGQKLYNSKGCVACHSADGTAKVGPSWKGLYSAVNHPTSAGDLSVDDNYLRESILNPNAKIVKGYSAGVMPSYQGQLTEAQLTMLIEFIKTLK
ncbi:MAG: cytochrome c oxidase subunit II [Bdellovibrio sp.]